MNATETIGYPCYDTGLGRIYIKEAIIQDVVKNEIAHSTYFFPPGTEIAYTESMKSSKGMRKHVTVLGTGNRIRIGLSADVLYGIPVQNEARHLQEKIKRSVELATGLSVEAVDLDIKGLVMSVEESPEDGEEGGAGL